MPSRHEKGLAPARPRPANVLAHLADPTTTRELARRLKTAESTISHHLQALTAAGLAIRDRRGRSVVYQLTELGVVLRGRLVDEAADLRHGQT